jgi:hypothetical protein
MRGLPPLAMVNPIRLALANAPVALFHWMVAKKVAKLKLTQYLLRTIAALAISLTVVAGESGGHQDPTLISRSCSRRVFSSRSASFAHEAAIDPPPACNDVTDQAANLLLN